MGFLLGAFGKLAAGRRVRQLQAKMMRVQSKLRRVTRQVESVSKMLETQKKVALNNLTATQNLANSQCSQALALTYGVDSTSSSLLGLTYDGTTTSTMTDEEKQKYINYQLYSTALSNAKAQNEASITMQKNEIEEKYANLEDALLEPLQQEEDELETEKESLESQIQIAQNDYEACKEMEKAGAKTMAPSYTGSVS